jgi:hypothetical protein
MKLPELASPQSNDNASRRPPSRREALSSASSTSPSHRRHVINVQPFACATRRPSERDLAFIEEQKRIMRERQQLEEVWRLGVKMEQV